jgi:hypothetical protein
MKFIFSKNDYIELLLHGGGIFIMDLVCSGSMKIPVLEIIFPNSFPSKKQILFSSGLEK